MAKLSPEERIANMAGLIKRQSVELLYKLNQLPSLESGELIHLTETLRDAAKRVRKKVTVHLDLAEKE
ncbi:MAG: Rop family plasmid primer RNA-binding protein [Gammaproteobacteria bacterium]|nr:Rop family plasmid primer RNA-binding protein [Gammaproteobacteria bacterium]